MERKSARPLAPVPPDGMELLFYYRCPRCGRHMGVSSPTEPRMIRCENCHLDFPIIPVDDHTIQYLHIMLEHGRATADPDFL